MPAVKNPTLAQPCARPASPSATLVVVRLVSVAFPFSKALRDRLREARGDIQHAYLKTHGAPIRVAMDRKILCASWFVAFCVRIFPSGVGRPFGYDDANRSVTSLAIRKGIELRTPEFHSFRRYVEVCWDTSLGGALLPNCTVKVTYVHVTYVSPEGYYHL